MIAQLIEIGLYSFSLSTTTTH